MTGYSGSAVLVIPASVSDGVTAYVVTAIGYRATVNTGLTSVTLPDGLTEIGDFAFAINRLVSVDVPASVTTIGENAFYGNGMTSVTLHEGLTDIGAWAFGSNRLVSVDIPASVTTIGEAAFLGNSLTSVTLRNGLTEIGGWAFQSNSLVSVVIPASVTTISEGAFYENGMTSVTLHEGLTEIGGWAFESNSLVSVVIPASVTTIGEGAFNGNDLESAFFAGAAPTLSGATTSDPSLGDPAGLTVHYLAKFSVDIVVGGFTSPTWMGYDSVIDPVATTITPVAAAVTWDLGLAVGKAVGGSTVTVSGVGLRSGSAYTVVVRSTPTTIAFGSAGVDGTFTGTGVMPAGLAAGAHTVTLSGTAANGSAVSSIAYFTVDAAGIVTYLSSVEAAVAKTSALAATGYTGAPLGFAALLVLLAGAALVVGRPRVAAKGIRA
ncbi:leucine-rich repeat domain-containing protein [Cryobacterium aureum]|uniref:leucine-rich repeat domain-containing protein n=1 Tax=Cryobacterium aureum TaxID=995037 RepID=UPI00196B70ED|nr:leucine-rich repeat domain-containing protein [Cryobacterium aureum]